MQKPEWLEEALTAFEPYFEPKQSGPPTPEREDTVVTQKKRKIKKSPTSEDVKEIVELNPEDFLDGFVGHVPSEFNSEEENFVGDVEIPDNIDDDLEDKINQLTRKMSQPNLNTYLLLQLLRSNEQLAKLLSVISTKLVEITLEKANQ